MGIMARLLRKDAPICTVGALEIRAPWIRASTDEDGIAGGFFTVTNTGPTADRLLSASSSICSLTIHAIKVVGGDIAMRRLEDGLGLPPQATITLRPRGYHLLLKGVTKPLAKGGRVPVTLCFERAGEAAVEFLVKEPGPVGDETLHEKGQPG
jgi:periplasmic copper chaperone A